MRLINSWDKLRCMLLSPRKKGRLGSRQEPWRVSRLMLSICIPCLIIILSSEELKEVCGGACRLAKEPYGLGQVLITSAAHSVIDRRRTRLARPVSWHRRCRASSKAVTYFPSWIGVTCRLAHRWVDGACPVETRVRCESFIPNWERHPHLRLADGAKDTFSRMRKSCNFFTRAEFTLLAL